MEPEVGEVKSLTHSHIMSVRQAALGLGNGYYLTPEAHV